MHYKDVSVYKPRVVIHEIWKTLTIVLHFNHKLPILSVFKILIVNFHTFLGESNEDTLLRYLEKKPMRYLKKEEFKKQLKS